MNWEAVGTVGEFLSAVAVVGSLEYLAMQVWQGYRQINWLELIESADEYIQAPPILAKYHQLSAVTLLQVQPRDG